MLREELLVDPRLVVEPLEVARGHELHQVLVAFVGLREKHQVVIGVGDASVHRLVEAALWSDVDLAPEDRLHPRVLRRLEETDRAEHVAVVGEGDRGHLVARRELHDVVDPARAVEEGEIAVVVEMDERSGHSHSMVEGGFEEIS